MSTKTKQILIIACILFAGGISVMGWTTFRVVAWARDLPNRVVVDEDAVAAAFGQAVIESLHSVLRHGDSAVQIQVLKEQFVPLIRQQEGAAWVRNEFGDDIAALVGSEDPSVSAAASQLLSMLDAAESPNIDAE